MKKFITKTLIFIFAISIIVLWLFSKADGHTDPFYLRFTTPKQENLILGTSRAAQGLQPKVFDSILHKKIFNYSFTISHSPFGPTYLNSIKKKLNTKTKNGIFIIAIDPWSISSFTETPNDSTTFRDLNLSLANTHFVNLNPNPFYLTNNWNDKYYKLLEENKSRMYLHKNGWLEVNVDLENFDIEKNIDKKVQRYREEYLPITKYSELRLNYLKKTISFLKTHGNVYLVRLPIHSKMMEIENELMPDFNEKIEKAIPLSNGYLDLTVKNNSFIYLDGNHLYKDSGKIVSEIVAEWIDKIK